MLSGLSAVQPGVPAPATMRGSDGNWLLFVIGSCHIQCGGSRSHFVFVDQATEHVVSDDLAALG